MPFQDFTAHLLDEYLDEMIKDGAYGDQITLRCIANLFNAEITMISTLRNGGRIFILPENSHPIGRILLGHFVEGLGDHCPFGSS